MKMYTVMVHGFSHSHSHDDGPVVQLIGVSLDYDVKLTPYSRVSTAQCQKSLCNQKTFTSECLFCKGFLSHLVLSWKNCDQGIWKLGHIRKCNCLIIDWDRVTDWLRPIPIHFVWCTIIFSVLLWGSGKVWRPQWKCTMEEILGILTMHILTSDFLIMSILTMDMLTMGILTMDILTMAISTVFRIAAGIFTVANMTNHYA